MDEQLNKLKSKLEDDLDKVISNRNEFDEIRTIIVDKLIVIIADELVAVGWEHPDIQ